MGNKMIYVLGDILMVFGLHIFCSKMYTDKKKYWLRITAVVSYVMIDCLINFFLNNRITFLITSIVLDFLFLFAYSARINYKNFIVTATFWIFGICSELLGNFLVSTFINLLGLYNAESEIIAVVILSRIFFFILILISMNFIKYQNKEEASLKQTIMVQQAYFDREKSVWENIRKIKHNSKNMLIAVKSDILAGKIDDALKTIDEELKIVDISQLPVCNILAIDSIIAYKSNLALSKDIKICPEFRIEHKPQIDSCDVCILIGNALDNAIEYLEKHPECKPEIRIRLVYSKGIFDIKIINEVSERVNIENNMIPTSKTEEWHGYGLKSIQRIAEKYDGMMFLSSTDNEFEFGVIMHCQIDEINFHRV